MPGKADFRLDLAQFPIMEFSDGLRILFNPGQALMNDEQNVIHHFWPDLKIIDVSYDASFDEVLEQVLKVAPYLGEHLGKNSQLDAEPLRSPSPSSEIPATGGHVFVHGKQQLVETLLRILGVSYTQNAEMSFPYAGIQISSHANWIRSGKGKPVLVDFGSFYGDAVQALEKSGFIVVQILDTDSIHQGIPRLLNAIGVSFAMDSAVPDTRSATAEGSGNLDSKRRAAFSDSDRCCSGSPYDPGNSGKGIHLNNRKEKDRVINDLSA